MGYIFDNNINVSTTVSQRVSEFIMEEAVFSACVRACVRAQSTYVIVIAKDAWMDWIWVLILFSQKTCGTIYNESLFISYLQLFVIYYYYYSGSEFLHSEKRRNDTK